MRELREMLRREVDKIKHKGSMSAGDLEVIYKLVDTIKDSYEIEEYEAEEHSHAGGMMGGGRGMNRGGGGGYNDGGNSYRRQRRDSRGRYSREGGYSYDDGMEEVWEILEMMEVGLPDEQREAIRRFRREMQK